jgi:hypothetical protein
MTSPNKSSSAEKANGLSAKANWQDSTGDALEVIWSTCRYGIVLPIQASPVMVSAAGAPEAAERKPRISPISGISPDWYRIHIQLPDSGLAHLETKENPC